LNWLIPVSILANQGVVVSFTTVGIVYFSSNKTQLDKNKPTITKREAVQMVNLIALCLKKSPRLICNNLPDWLWEFITYFLASLTRTEEAEFQIEPSGIPNSDSLNLFELFFKSSCKYSLASLISVRSVSALIQPSRNF